MDLPLNAYYCKFKSKDPTSILLPFKLQYLTVQYSTKLKKQPVETSIKDLCDIEDAMAEDAIPCHIVLLRDEFRPKSWAGSTGPITFIEIRWCTGLTIFHVISLSPFSFASGTQEHLPKQVLHLEFRLCRVRPLPRDLMPRLFQ